MHLREIIESCNIRTCNNSYIPYGVDINKSLIPSRANLIGVDLSNYKIVNKGYFACNLMHICRDMCLPIAHNYSFEKICISPAYYVFKIKSEMVSEVDKYFLLLYFQSKEQDRKCWFYCDGSVRGNLSEDRFLDINIPIPSIKIQHQYADAYNSLKKLAEQNEAMIKPLQEFCTGFMAKMTTKYESSSLGKLIIEYNERNFTNKFNVEDVKGVSNDGIFCETKAKTQGINFANYKIVQNRQFAYNPSRINIGSIAIMKEEACIVSPMYIVFGITSEMLVPEYLNIYFRRTEFQRSTLYYASGSVRDTFDFESMCRVKIPLPPIEVQESIVAIFKCAEKARSIAERARKEMKRICPAMIQRAAHQ